jgi:hypothetical protein
MSFGLTKFKKEQEEKIEKSNVPHLIVSEDIFGLLLYQKLREKHGADQVRLYWLGSDAENFIFDELPSSLRGATSLELFKRRYPDVSLTSLGTPEFLKEGRLRPFGGRSKSEKLLWGEEYFTQEGFQFDWSDVITEDDRSDLLGAIKDSHRGVITKVERSNNDDEAFEWNVIEATGHHFNCDHLYWGQSAARLLELVEDKTKVTDKFIEFCESTQSPHCLRVRWEFSERGEWEQKTLFLPLSYTHDWGHLIGESRTEGDKLFSEFVTFIDPNESSEEEVSKKIRHLKKNIEKIYPEWKKNFCNEFISLVPNVPCLKIDDSMWTKELGLSNKLSFVGYSAPLTLPEQNSESFEDSWSGLRGVTRGLMSLGEIGD